MGDVSDVVIVGGGIAGSALAYALASAGRTVTVLESSVEYEDRVRGEAMMPWAVRQARIWVSSRSCSTRGRMWRRRGCNTSKGLTSP